MNTHLIIYFASFSILQPLATGLKCWSCASENLEAKWSNNTAMKNKPLDFTNDCLDPANLTNLRQVDCPSGPCFDIISRKEDSLSAVRGCWSRLIKGDPPISGNQCRYNNSIIDCFCNSNGCNIKTCYNCASSAASQEPLLTRPDVENSCEDSPTKGSVVACSTYCVTMYQNLTHGAKVLRGCWDQLVGGVPPSDAIDTCKSGTERTAGEQNGRPYICVCSDSNCNYKTCHCSSAMQPIVSISIILLSILLLCLH